jgi:hypothetical protein
VEGETVKQPAKKGAQRCLAQGLSRAEHDRCVLPAGAGGHDMARSKGALGLPVLIHRDAEGNEWTIHGVYQRQQKQEAS